MNGEDNLEDASGGVEVEDPEDAPDVTDEFDSNGRRRLGIMDYIPPQDSKDPLPKEKVLLHQKFTLFEKSVKIMSIKCWAVIKVFDIPGPKDRMESTIYYKVAGKTKKWNEFHSLVEVSAVAKAIDYFKSNCLWRIMEL